ncbi:leucine-rich repeat extensin-like protein 5 isoform X1 [Hyalella azteca]|uniref:Leucine-rich repeat extensin-like protein 5 isoform X1 n=1 Tax=Hyalella azteca TaxID=294128 RepID=A0A8B7NRD6_HYAAZ|nr:leucine-rich repeat extensin-like protein 5 isoform X1 [Hyalella azteca]
MVKVRFVLLALMLALMVLPESDGAPTLLTKAKLLKKAKFGKLALGKGGSKSNNFIHTPQVIYQPVLYKPVPAVRYVSVPAPVSVPKLNLQPIKTAIIDHVVGHITRKALTSGLGGAFGGSASFSAHSGPEVPFPLLDEPPVPSPPKVSDPSPVAPPKASYGIPVAPPSTSYGSPVAPPSVSYGSPVAPPSASYGSPVAPPSASYGSPVAPPSVSFSNPVNSAPISQFESSYSHPAPPPSDSKPSPVPPPSVSFSEPRPVPPPSVSFSKPRPVPPPTVTFSEPIPVLPPSSSTVFNGHQILPTGPSSSRPNDAYLPPNGGSSHTSRNENFEGQHQSDISSHARSNSRFDSQTNVGLESNKHRQSGVLRSQFVATINAGFGTSRPNNNPDLNVHIGPPSPYVASAPGFK